MPTVPPPDPSSRDDHAMSVEEARQADLYRRHLRGDRTALEELLVSIEPRLFSLCLRMAGDPQDARDLCQEAMVKVIKGLPNFGGRSRLSTWMIRITMNVCLTSRRRARIRKTSSLDSPGGGSGKGAAAGQGMGSQLRDPREPAVEQRIQEAEELAALAAGISLMEPEQRALLILRDAQDMEYGEIAELLGVPVGTIKSRLFRARQALRTLVEGASGKGRSS